MAFCEFSSEVISKNSVSIENQFITDFLPNAEGDYVKVYLYGLYLCGTSKDNSIDVFEKNLGLTREDILSIFYYWQERGLVQVINIEPPVIRYLPVGSAIKKLKKYNVDKYTSFNISAQEILGSKMLTPREFEELYYLIENLGQEKECVLKIIDYCVKLKGQNVSVNYVVSVAKNWAYEGVKTSADADERMETQERLTGDINLVIKAMGFKRQATVEEFGQFLTWSKDMEIPTELIVAVTKKSKAKSFVKLNDYVLNCYALKLSSVKEINEYFDARENMMALAKNVVKNLGLYYSDLSSVVDTYIMPWLQLGFEQDAILKLSNYAFKSSIRTLEGLNNQMQNMFKLGVLTSSAIDNYMDGIVKNDEDIGKILSKLGIERRVNSADRLFYKTWIYDWGVSADIIEYAVTLSQNKYMPLQYLNKVLSQYHSANVTTLEDAKNVAIVGVSTNDSKGAKEARKREYSKEQLDSLFDNIYEVEI